jgi:hypothetical protein
MRRWKKNQKVGPDVPTNHTIIRREAMTKSK